MKRRVTLTIDSDVYDQLQDLPRKVSVSEVVSVVLRGLLKQAAMGREMTKEELVEWIERTPEGKELRQRVREEWGPTVWAFENAVKEVMTDIVKAATPEKTGKKKKK